MLCVSNIRAGTGTNCPALAKMIFTILKYPFKKPADGQQGSVRFHFFKVKRLSIFKINDGAVGLGIVFGVEQNQVRVAAESPFAAQLLHFIPALVKVRRTVIPSFSVRVVSGKIKIYMLA